jgi:membrane associated rhomboid family serine protease
MNQAPDSTPARRQPPRPHSLVGLTVAAMWVTEGVDQFVLDERLDQYGIVPRELEGLSGVVLAPFLHAGFGHLMANTVPLVILGALLAFKGVTRLVAVTAGVVVLGGAGVWLFGRTGVHLGASGVVFGYLGYLVAAGLFERRLRSVVLGALAVLLYGGAIWGVLPTGTTVSWEGHLSGLLAGVFMAWILTKEARRNR